MDGHNSPGKSKVIKSALKKKKPKERIDYHSAGVSIVIHSPDGTNGCVSRASVYSESEREIVISDPVKVKSEPVEAA